MGGDEVVENEYAMLVRNWLLSLAYWKNEWLLRVLKVRVEEFRFLKFLKSNFRVFLRRYFPWEAIIWKNKYLTLIMFIALVDYQEVMIKNWSFKAKNWFFKVKGKHKENYKRKENING